MENAGYVALSRQLTLRRELDIAANNIANANTVGFKVEQLLTNSVAARPARNDDIGYPTTFVMDNGVGRDFAQGSLEQTGRSLDVAIEAEGSFFTLQGPNGPLYTRDGRFTLSPEGVLVSAQGYPVLADGAELRLDPEQGDLTISADGVVSQGVNRVGTLSVVRFAELGVLQKTGDGNYRNTSNAQPEAATDARLRQGMIEQSNVNPLVEITNLIEISRAYERVTRIVEQTGDLSRRSVERLGRVS